MSGASGRVLQTARQAKSLGLSVVPPRQDGTKQPLGEWKQYQKAIASDEQIGAWYANGLSGVGIVPGKVSQNLEMLDFDDPGIYRAYKALADVSGLGELVERIEAGYCEETPGGGTHWPYYCTEIAGNTKLAQRPKRPDEMQHPNDRVKSLIETRGEGGYIVSAPSNGTVHPTGRPYRLLRGDLSTIATIMPDERRALWQLAKTFGEMPKSGPTVRATLGGDGARPGDDFNQRADWANILEPYGWRSVYQRGEATYWRRPGKDRGISATSNYEG
jgi:Bifunctional DNA primase/polymerase, N-terminal